MTADYRTVNRANWDERAPAHAASPDYGLDRFVADPAHLHPVVRFDLPRLGDLTGLRGVHLQCHIGTDTISLSRLGARMTGLDFSPAAVAEARRLAERLGDPTDFVESDVYAAADVLEAGTYDLVFTGIGALCWLPSVDQWAAVVARLLKPGGRLFIREGHPVLWSLDDAADQLIVRYPYFETPDPLVFVEDGTYVATDAVFTQNETHSWNHGLGEIVTALLAHGLRLTMLVEHDSVPWEGLPGRMVRGDDDEWRLPEGRERVPLSYTLQAVKMGG
ncbi:methyltransferase [Asanoa ishikariensis]|uniref:Methyltransferase domain-containing protein n=1 Tax=Asanoa ishikariensis TaxID=137265 RepID=A0A1H3T8N9_9ACTN|nr:class I SAM-dependent methyltransferase [Asanoa ishikariensis]GIF62854.1 methyltransferase [Asanoa ishikariensis]SDZ46596.1 Methyltransferase domain-containing protein [Asanoa ishikariensis]